MVASGKESAFQCRRCKRLRFDPGSGRFPGYANPFQYSCLGNPWTEEPGRLQSMRLQRVGYILVTKQAGKESLLNLVLETEILFSEEQYLTWILNQIEERVITSKQAEKLKRQTWSQTEWGLGLSESQLRRDLQVKGSMSRVSGSSGGVEGFCSSPPAKAPKSQLAVEQPQTGGCWNLPKKDTPCPKIKKKWQEMVGGAQSR